MFTHVAVIGEKILLESLDVYQALVAPWFGHQCRYYPSCSSYMRKAVEIHGFWRGFGLGLGRILRCQPFGGFGHDPVPNPLKRET